MAGAIFRVRLSRGYLRRPGPSPFLPQLFPEQHFMNMNKHLRLLKALKTVGLAGCVVCVIVAACTVAQYVRRDDGPHERPRCSLYTEAGVYTGRSVWLTPVVTLLPLRVPLPLEWPTRMTVWYPHFAVKVSSRLSASGCVVGKTMRTDFREADLSYRYMAPAVSLQGLVVFCCNVVLLTVLLTGQRRFDHHLAMFLLLLMVAALLCPLDLFAVRVSITHPEVFAHTDKPYSVWSNNCFHATISLLQSGGASLWLPRAMVLTVVGSACFVLVRIRWALRRALW